MSPMLRDGRLTTVAKSRVLPAVLLTLLLAGASAGQAVTLVFEGEHYTWIKPSMRKGTDDGASQKGYVEIPLQRPHGEQEGEPFDDGSVTFKINIPQNGKYWLWARTWWYDSCGNSFFVMVDDMSPEIPTYITSTKKRKWGWVRGRQYTLAAGYHVIRFQNREDGAKLDQFLLTTAPEKWEPKRAYSETAQYLWQPEK